MFVAFLTMIVLLLALTAISWFVQESANHKLQDHHKMSPREEAAYELKARPGQARP